LLTQQGLVLNEILKKGKLTFSLGQLQVQTVMPVCSAHLRFAGLDQQSGLAPGIIDGRPHLFYNLPLPPQLLHQYQVILLGDRGTWV